MQTVLIYLFLFCFSLVAQHVIPDSLLLSDKPIKHPATAMLLSSALPGAGQYYNEDYIASGVILTSLSFFVTKAIINHNEIQDLAKTRATVTDLETYKSELSFLYYKRNTSVWYSLGIYTLNIIHAYAGAYLFKFDEMMGENGAALSIEPSKNKGLQLSLTYTF